MRLHIYVVLADKKVLYLYHASSLGRAYYLLYSVKQ